MVVVLLIELKETLVTPMVKFPLLLVLVIEHDATTPGVTAMFPIFCKLVVPCEFVTASVTSYTPVLGNVMVGFCSVEVIGEFTLLLKVQRNEILV